MVPVRFSPVLRLARNTAGRDFVMGDAHGAFELVARALDAVDFDPERDRLLAPGDLVDRGGLSYQAQAYLKLACFFSTRGNHEQMALDVFGPDGELLDPATHLPWLIRNGMAWWLDLSPAQRLERLRVLERLPFVIEVDTDRGPIGILHADVPQGLSWSQFIERVEALDEHTLQTCLWGRQRITAEECNGVEGIGRVFVGHTPQWYGLGRYGNVYALDTGAVFGQNEDAPGAALTMANVLSATNAMTAARPVQLLNIVDEVLPSPGPFGSGPGYIGHAQASNWMAAWLKAR